MWEKSIFTMSSEFFSDTYTTKGTMEANCLPCKSRGRNQETHEIAIINTYFTEKHHDNPTYWDNNRWVNSADPDQSIWAGCASFGVLPVTTTLDCKINLLSLYGQWLHFEGKQLYFTVFPFQWESTLKRKNLLLGSKFFLSRVDSF